MIKDENYINIAGWMITKLKLKGNQLMIYAIIYGFSQEENSSFNGSLQYLADWTNSTKQGVLGAIKELLNKELILKEETIKNGIKFCSYKYNEEKLNSIKQSLMGIKQSLTGGIKQSLMGIKQSLMNNIEYNIDNNINNNIDNSCTQNPEIKPLDKVVEFYNLYNETVKRLPKATKLTEARKKKIKSRLKELDFYEWKKVFEKCDNSDFCSGKNSTWKANFDWLIANESNYVKVLEGNYDNKFSLRKNENKTLQELQEQGMNILKATPINDFKQAEQRGMSIL